MNARNCLLVMPIDTPPSGGWFSPVTDLRLALLGWRGYIARMPWRGLSVLIVLAAILVGWFIADSRARLVFLGPADITNGALLGVAVGEDENTAVQTLRAQMGVPTIIEPEPARGMPIPPFHSYTFHDHALYNGYITLDVRDGRVFRIRVEYMGPFNHW